MYKNGIAEKGYVSIHEDMHVGAKAKTLQKI